MNQQEKLEQVMALEQAGVLQQAKIAALRSNCPFCFSQASFFISLRSQTSAPTYSCSTCGEVGALSELRQNLKAVSTPPKAVTSRHHGKVNEMEVQR